MTKNAWLKLVMLSPVILLSACVTQSYENDSPIIENNVSKNEKAATRISLGLGYLNMGNMSQAKLNLEKAKRFAPGLVQVYTAFAHYYETVGENDLTIQSFEKALSISADDADTLNNYGVFLCRQDQIQQAEIQLLKAIAVPSYLLVAQSYENLASCFLQIDNFTKAEQYLSKAIAHSPNRTVTLLQMVRLQYAMGHYNQAKIFLKKFERNTNRFSPNSLALAYKVYWKLGERKKAKNYGSMLVRMYPQTWESKQYLLNNLEQIKADDLAQRYNITQRIKNSSYTSSNVKKRVVKLSPKKSSSDKNASNHKKLKATPLVVAKPTFEAITKIKNKDILSENLENKKKTDKLEATNKPDNLEVAGELATDQNNTETLVEQEIESVSEKTNNELERTSNTIKANNSIDKSKKTINDVELKKETEAIVAFTTSVPVILASNADGESANILLNTSLDESSDLTKQEAKLVTSLAIETKTEPEADKNIFLASVPKSETFTEPVPAKRDAPLPEIIDYVEEKNTNDDLATETANEELTKTLVKDQETLNSDILTEIKNTEIKKYTVKEGDTLYAISVMYNIKVEALIKWNEMSVKQSLPVGKQLYIENPETVNNINE